MKKTEIIRKIKKEIKKLEDLFAFLNDKSLFVEDSQFNIKLISMTYTKILENKKNMYLTNRINIQRIQNKIKYEYKTSKYNSIKKIYNRIIYINDFLLKYYDNIFKKDDKYKFYENMNLCITQHIYDNKQKTLTKILYTLDKKDFMIFIINFIKPKIHNH